MKNSYSPQEALLNYFDELLAEEEPAIQYAEPDRVQQQKLEKLLQSAQPKVVLTPESEKPVAVTPIAEIQDWEIASHTPESTNLPTSFSDEGEVSRKATTEARESRIAASESAIISPELESVRQNVSEPDTGNLDKSSYTVEGLAWAANGRPQWAQNNFDVLLFQVSGLTLAVPLISLGQIQPLTDELTPLFGQADWFMGLLPSPTGKIRTVNTAKFVMPERYDENFVKTAKYVISIDGVPWGLAVDSVNQPITLKPTDVKWRGERTKRPWLAGTVKDHMCALLDIPMIGQMLIEADRNSPKAKRSAGAR